MQSKTKKRIGIGIALFFAVLLLIPTVVHLDRYRMAVENSLSQAVGRKVTIQSLSLQTFPRPGLLLSGLVIDDDPAISAEPMLRSDEVLMTLRLSSLWHWRFEVSSLRLSFPSVNLVRGSNGDWNIKSLLERARQIPTLPTATSKTDERRPFPYIESDRGRINVKINNEKKVYALGDADFALWSESENEWRMRLEARPIRTDANLGDTGLVKVQARWQRAANLSETPISVRFWWNDGQLGQITSLLHGRDFGWRGEVTLNGTAQGNATNLKTILDLRVDDFRRYDIATTDSVNLRAHCDLQVNIPARQMPEAYCRSPFSAGMIQARANFNAGTLHPSLFTVWAENIPAQSLLSLARHMKKSIPEDTSVSGSAMGFAVLRSDGAKKQWTGRIETTELQLNSSVISKPLTIGAMHWKLVGPNVDPVPPAKKPNKHARLAATAVPPEMALLLDPVPFDVVPTSKANSLSLSGSLTRKQFALQLTGEAKLPRVIEIARAGGLPTPATELNGSAQGTIRITGQWAFRPIEYSADAHLLKVTAKIPGVASPMEIQSARFATTPDAFTLSDGTATFADLRSTLNFSGKWPRTCSLPDSYSCTAKFSIKADQLDVDEVNALLNPKAQRQTWYAAIANTVMGRNPKAFPAVRATGTIAATKLIVKGVPAAGFTSSLELRPGGFTLKNISAELMGGKYLGQLDADFHADAPSYTSTGTFDGVALASLATLMRDPWASGKAVVNYTGSASGWSSTELLASAKGEGSFKWHDGALPHILLEPAGPPLRFHTLSGTLHLKDGIFSLSESKLQSPKGIYLVSGTASLGRKIDLILTQNGAPGYTVSGTLEKPKVTLVRTPESAALK